MIDTLLVVFIWEVHIWSAFLESKLTTQSPSFELLLLKLFFTQKIFFTKYSAGCMYALSRLLKRRQVFVSVFNFPSTCYIRTLSFANNGKQLKLAFGFFFKGTYWAGFRDATSVIRALSAHHSYLLIFNSLSRLAWFPLLADRLFPHVGNDGR